MPLDLLVRPLTRRRRVGTITVARGTQLDLARRLNAVGCVAASPAFGSGNCTAKRSPLLLITAITVSAVS